MKYADDSLEWHDENELIRKLDAVEAVLNMADSLDDVVDILMAVPSVDYVPKEFHDKTCEAMAKRHQEEIADMVSVVRCKECKRASPNKEGDYDCKCHIPIFRVDAEGYCYSADRKESE